MSTAAAIGLAMGTRWVLRKSWSEAVEEEPPDDPSPSGTTWPAALAWGAITGAAVGMSRVVAHRLATAAEEALG